MMLKQMLRVLFRWRTLCLSVVGERFAIDPATSSTRRLEISSRAKTVWKEASPIMKQNTDPGSM